MDSKLSLLLSLLCLVARIRFTFSEADQTLKYTTASEQNIFDTAGCLIHLVNKYEVSQVTLGKTNSFKSVHDLEKSMYTQIYGFPCVRLLNLSGEVGCSNPGHGNVVAPIVRFKNAKELMAPVAIVVAPDEFENLLSRHLTIWLCTIYSSHLNNIWKMSNDSDFAGKVNGILVESGTQVPNGLRGFSPDVKFPGSEFAPYGSNNFEWNPAVCC
ncbi:hypothetical protein OROGR_023842 [Orobanche gracilis]